jgi:hypothetical protein
MNERRVDERRGDRIGVDSSRLRAYTSAWLGAEVWKFVTQF